MIPTYELMGLSREEYEQTATNLYIDWCSLQSKDVRDWQLICASPMVANYWSREFRKLERSFNETASSFVNENVSPGDRQKYFMKLMNTLYEGRNPIDLINEVTKGVKVKNIIMLN